jgi:transcriptional regulator with XRE-family HTH domain
MRKKDPPHDQLIRQRIRNRRKVRGMTAYELADRAGISPSYMSLIESGSKLPSEEIAVRIAEALDDDVDLYRAWVQASRYPDFGKHIERLLRLERVGSTPESRARVRRGGRIGDEASPSKRPGGRFAKARPGSASERMRRWARRLASKGAEPDEAVMSEGVASLDALDQSSFAVVEDLASSDSDAAPTVEVPLLSDGADPWNDPGDADDVIEWLQIDSRFLPPGIEQPFAYRPGEAAVERVRGLIRPGDVVVLTTQVQSVDPSGIYAIRYEDGVVLSRLVRHGSMLLGLRCPVLSLGGGRSGWRGISLSGTATGRSGMGGGLFSGRRILTNSADSTFCAATTRVTSSSGATSLSAPRMPGVCLPVAFCWMRMTSPDGVAVKL